jgi:hypothetical protein
VGEVEDLTQVAAEPVEGVHHDRVTAPGVLQQFIQPVTVDGGTCLLVGVDPFDGYARSGQSVELTVQALPGGGDADVAEVKPARRVIVTGSHARHRTGNRRRSRIAERVLRNEFRNGVMSGSTGSLARFGDRSGSKVAER